MPPARKILLLNPPGKKSYLRDYYCPNVAKARYVWPPGDLLLQSGILSQVHFLKVIDAIASGLSPQKTLGEIERFQPDLIFFLTSSLSWEEDRDFLRQLKTGFHPVLIGSGDMLQFQGEKIFRENLFLDGILLDLISDSILKFLDHPGVTIPNLIYRNNHEIVSGPRIRPADPFEVPAAKYELFPISRYSLPFGNPGLWGSSYTSYGCPYSCYFCPVPEMGFRLRKVENIIEELHHLQSLKINNLVFRDSSLTNVLPHTLDLINRMKAENLYFNWICHSRPDTITPQFLQLMRQSGCFLIMFGIENGNEEVRKIHKMTISNEEIRALFQACRESKIKILAHFILGLPGESPDSVQDTINFAINSGCDYMSFNILFSRSATAIPTIDHIPLSGKQRIKILRRAHRKFYLRPRIMYHHLAGIKSLSQLWDNIRSGISLFRNKT
jgi:radical SAM superfamily enzyme YgiQ (UPF0313 family)